MANTDLSIQDKSVSSSDESTVIEKVGQEDNSYGNGPVDVSEMNPEYEPTSRRCDEVGQEDIIYDNESADDSDKDPGYEPSSSSSDSEFHDEYLSNEENASFQEDIACLTVESEKSDEDPQGSAIVQKRKQFFCYICESCVTNFARHICRNHSMHVEVQKILAHPKGSKQRNHLLTLLRKKGNYLNDPEEGKPVRHGTESTNYLPCIHCLGFYSAKNLWRHRKQCSENPNTVISMAGTKASAQNFQLNYLKVDSDLIEKVFPRMRADKISLIAKKDNLICDFGARYLKTHKEKHFLVVTSRKMRELSRLLLEIKIMSPSVKNLFDVLKPQYYDLLVAASKNVAKYDRKISNVCDKYQHILEAVLRYCNSSYTEENRSLQRYIYSRS